MAAQQLHRAINDLRTHGGFGQVGDPEDQRASRLQAVENSGGAQVVGFAGLGRTWASNSMSWRKWADAAPGQQALLDALAIGKQANAVAGVERQLGQRNRGRAGVVELGVDLRPGAVILFTSGPRRLPGNAATRDRISRPQSSTIHTAWLRSVWY